MYSEFSDRVSRRLDDYCVDSLYCSTLYCAKGNYEFGISRVIKSLEPYSRKVCVCIVHMYVCVHLDVYKCAHVYMSVVHAHLYFCVCFINVRGKCPDWFLLCTLWFLLYTQLGTDTWFYSKRCFVSLIENMVR